MPGPDRQGTLAGLTSAEAALRLRQWGPNVLAPPSRFAAARQIAAWLGSPLILILLVASAISAALGQHAGSVVIALMVVLGAGLNATQAYRSQAAAKRLRERVGQRYRGPRRRSARHPGAGGGAGRHRAAGGGRSGSGRRRAGVGQGSLRTERAVR
jgi:magnesium-transporting ATPase (P-type)